MSTKTQQLSVELAKACRDNDTETVSRIVFDRDYEPWSESAMISFAGVRVFPANLLLRCDQSELAMRLLSRADAPPIALMTDAYSDSPRKVAIGFFRFVVLCDQFDRLQLSRAYALDAFQQPQVAAAIHSGLVKTTQELEQLLQAAKSLPKPRCV